MKNSIWTDLFFILVFILAMFLLVGCESKKTADAGLDGMIVKDGNGRYWMLNHNIGDTYFLKEVKTNSVLH